jgi:hypothetical protein
MGVHVTAVLLCSRISLCYDILEKEANVRVSTEYADVH